MFLWGREGDSYFNALHFAFAVGGILSPLAAAPYVMSRDYATNTLAMNWTLDFSNTTSGNDADLYNVTHLNSTKMSHETQSSMIYIPYTTSAGICFVTSLPFLVFFCVSLQKTLEREKPKEEMKNKRRTQKRLQTVGFIIMTVYMAVYCAVQDVFIGFLTTFVIAELNWANSEGSYLTSGYGALYALGRFLGIFLVRCLSPAKMIFAHNSMLILSLSGFLMMSFHDVTTGVWIFTLMTGFSTSMIFPVVFMWTEQKFLRVTGKVASIFIVASSVGSIVNSPILGVLMEMFTPMWFCYLLLAEAIFVFILFFAGLFIARRIDLEKSKLTELEISVFNEKVDG
jgi:FHS family Na+ dependent glucose MFS transporter 1